MTFKLKGFEPYGVVADGIVIYRVWLWRPRLQKNEAKYANSYISVHAGCGKGLTGSYLLYFGGENA